MTRNLVVAVDQGTSSTKAVLFDQQLREINSHTVPIGIETRPGGVVEQSPDEIFSSVCIAIDEVSKDYVGEIAGVCLSNQRESALVFTPDGKALSPVLGWQDRRTASVVDSTSQVEKDYVRRVTGLPLDPMFSALKFKWILDEIDPDRVMVESGSLILGTIDSWIVQKLTGSLQIEAGNAHRTQLVDVNRGTWSQELCDYFSVPISALPPIRGSACEELTLEHTVLKGLPLLAVLADSHAALYAHHSELKITFGTGSSLMALAEKGAESAGLVKTIAWSKGAQNFSAFEGNILSSGATVTWLSRLFGKSPSELAELAETVEPSMTLVPAFGGLAAPWWNSNAKALAIGMTQHSSIAHFARAAFDAMAFQALDLVDHVEKTLGRRVETVGVDGGPTANPWFAQLLADVFQRKVFVPDFHGLSAAGAAEFGAVEAGVWPESSTPNGMTYLPNVDPEHESRKKQWHDAVQLSLEGK